MAQAPPCYRIWGFKRVRALTAQVSLGWYPPTLDLGLQGNPPTKKIGTQVIGLIGQQGWEGISEALNAWCRNPLPSLILFLGAFGAMGTAFEELRRGGGLPAIPLFFLSFLILLFLFPIPGPQ